MVRTRLWWRLFISYLWVPALMLLVVGFYGSGVVRRLYSDHLNDDLEARARLVGKQIEELLSHGQADRQADRVDRLCKELGRSTGTRITVVLPTGEVVGDSEANPADMDNHKKRAEISEAILGVVGRTTRYSYTEREDRIYVAVPLLQGERVAAVVRTSLPFTALTRAIGDVRNQIAVAGLVGMLFYAIISLMISRRMSRPLEEIKDGADRFARGDLDHRLAVDGSMEIVAVAEAMNQMAKQLNERIQTVLRQQNEHEAMLSSMEEGVLAVDNDGTILSMNKACATLLGGESAKLRGRTVYEVIRKPDLLRFVELALASPTPIDGEIQLRGPRDRWLTAHGTTLQDNERGTIGVLIVLHDVTRLRHLEEVRRDFVANVSHELRTPITSIKGFIETILDGALNDKENAVRFLRIMLRQVNRLDAIIGDLLALLRIEKGSDEQRIEMAVDSIRGVLAAAAETCEKKAADKGIRIELVCADDLSGEINAALLEQAIINLLDNALKYSDAGSAVEVRAARENGELTIRVSDHGCGIETRHLPRLFERFYRVDKARSRELGGTGLGLAIVRHIVLAHHGSVSVESTVGVGSEFCLRLPIVQPKPDRPVSEEPAAPADAG